MIVQGKLGTMPETLVVDNRCRLQFNISDEGRKVRVRKAGPGHKWKWVRFDRYDKTTDCFLFSHY